ncbi:MAG: hypothetical protein KatS3mg111_2969 [Pirellulaceae bacterium]|nr:MAG: hypothetical protein KatS3mg111_2969 [Pirellulaceae bacterium]
MRSIILVGVQGQAMLLATIGSVLTSISRTPVDAGMCSYSQESVHGSIPISGSEVSKAFRKNGVRDGLFRGMPALAEPR